MYKTLKTMGFQLPTSTGDRRISEPSTVTPLLGDFVQYSFVEKIEDSNENTPRKTNMEPENEPLEEEIPIRNHHFQVPC